MKREISSYIPHDLLRDFSEDLKRITIGGKFLEGTLIMIDISGFTPLLARLAEIGMEGVEETSGILNDVFSEILDIVYVNGGVIMKFSGDAVICLFRGVEGDIRKTSRLQAIRASFQIMDLMQNYEEVDTLTGKISLEVSIGINSGRFQDYLVGSDIRMERILTGTVLEDLVKAQNYSEKGEIVITRSSVKYIEDLIIYEHIEFEKYFRLYSISQRIDLEIPEKKEVDIDLISDISIKPFIPERLFQKASIGSEELSMMGEHRHSTVLFLNFTNLVRTPQSYNAYFNDVIEIVSKYDGTLAKVDNHTIGDRLMITFGVLKAHEDDEDRACNCARDIIDIIPAKYPGLKQRFGIASGNVFAGNIGSLKRREYTTIGSIVNLSARLMANANYNSININKNLCKEIKNDFYIDGPGLREYKGFTTKQEVFVLRERKEIPEFIEERKPIVGRKKDLEHIKSIIKDVEGEGVGKILSISGPAGIGKSRLTEETISIAVKSGFRVFTGDCISFGEMISYYPWREILRGIFGVSQYDDPEIVIEKLETVLKDIGKSIWTPILAQLMGFNVEDNEFTATLGPKHKKGTAFNIIATYLDALSQKEPILIVLEDLHWIDTASIELLEYLFTMFIYSPVFILLVFRPEFNPQKFAELPNYSQIELEPFDIEDVASLVKSRLLTEDIPKNLIDLFVERTDGNPFYIEEMINLMVEEGVLQKDNITNRYEIAIELTDINIPSSISDIIIARVDKLSELDKNILKIASVIGRIFKFSVLNKIQNNKNNEQLNDTLKNFERFDITLIHKRIPELEYIFKHILTREVVYSLISYMGRREIHRRVGEYIEEKALDLSEQFEVLSHHFINAQYWQKGYDYSLKSAEKNAKVYSCKEALSFYENSYECLEELYKSGSISKDKYINEKYKILIGINDQLEILALRDRQKENLDILVEIADEIGLPLKLSEVYYKISSYYSLIGEQNKAVEFAVLALEKIKGLTSGNAKDIRCNIHIQIGKSYWYSQRFKEALEEFEKALKISEINDYFRQRVRILIDIGVVYMNMGDFLTAQEYFENSHKIIETGLTDVYLEIEVLGKLGAIYGNLEQYDKAIKILKKHYERSSEIGARKEILQGLINLAVASSVLYRYDDYQKYATEALELSKEMKFPRGMYAALQLLANLYTNYGLYEIAIEYSNELLELSEKLDIKDGLIASCLIMGSIYIDKKEFNKAFEQSKRALEIAKKTENKFLLSEVLLICAWVKLKMREIEEAEKYVEENSLIVEEMNKEILICGNLLMKSRILRDKNEFKNALENIKRAVELLEGKPVDLKILLEYYKVQKALDNKSEADEILERAHDIIIQRVDTIPEKFNKKSYLENNPIISEIIDEYKRIS